MITYRSDLDGVTADDVNGFFEEWPSPPSADALLAVLRASTHSILAVDGDLVVGFVNALSDGLLAAYIPLLEVRSSHRGSGIGSELVRRMLDLAGDVYMTDVVCDDDVAPFYERLGLVRLTGMARRNFGASILRPADQP